MMAQFPHVERIPIRAPSRYINRLRMALSLLASSIHRTSPIALPTMHSPSTCSPLHSHFLLSLLFLLTLLTLTSAKTIIFINPGTAADKLDFVKGTSRVYPNTIPIKGTKDPAKFSKHRYGLKFSYHIPVPPKASYSVILFLAETYEKACIPGTRVFNVFAHDSSKPASSGKSFKNIDVFKRAGCRVAHQITIRGIAVGASGVLQVDFVAVKNNAMIGSLQVNTASTSPTGTASPPSSGGPPPPPPPPPASGSGSGPRIPKNSLLVNVGAFDKRDVPVPFVKRTATTKSVSRTKCGDSGFYNKGRYGTDFSYSFNLDPGQYDVIVGFSEFYHLFCDAPGKRVFHVYVNGFLQLESYDIFEDVGCYKGVEKKLGIVSVSSLKRKPLVIRFERVLNFALVNLIKIVPTTSDGPVIGGGGGGGSSGGGGGGSSGGGGGGGGPVKGCVPASSTGSTGGLDHAAHAVPGSYPRRTGPDSPTSYVDGDGDGFHAVQISGVASHSHFFDSAKNIIGVITKYKWTIVESDKVISNKGTFTYKFPLGTTRLRLEVMDNSCTTDQAETTVTVTGSEQPGAYCYYYKTPAKNLVGGKAGSLTNPRPDFAAISSGVNFGFPSFPFRNGIWAARCFFFLDCPMGARSGKVSISTGGTGDAKVFKGKDLVLDTMGKTTATTALPKGLIGFEIIYHRRSTAKPPKLVFSAYGKVPANSKIKHDRKAVMPILTSLLPKEGPNSGGTRVRVFGHGLFQPLRVKFGTKIVPVLESSGTSFVVAAPPGSGSVKITAITAQGRTSNALTFKYGSKCDSIGFTNTALKTPGGGDVGFLELPTCATIGGDGKIYMGTLGATVQVLGYDVSTLKTTTHCYSKSIFDGNFKKGGKPSVRDILGITFDPRDKIMRPWVSTSSLFWHKRDIVDRSNKVAWRNGAVDRLKPGKDPSDKKICLIYDKRVVSNLPVSNNDHSVNGLVFSQSGTLLISVGGFTNAGLPAFGLGGHWETQLSGAILEAKVNKPGFNGNIKYSSTDPRVAKKVSGDVDIYATGLRNAYAITMARSGNIYASDMGPNCGKGDVSTTCADYDSGRQSKWNPNGDEIWRGKVKYGGEPKCPYGIGREDKIVQVIKGSFYGHPNIQRGGNQCAYIDPRTGKTANGKAAPSNYRAPLRIVQSPVTGLAEYGGGHFCGNMRGELVMSKYKGLKTHRMGVSGGKVTSGPNELSSGGGIQFVEDAHGYLLFPMLNAKKVFVLKPQASLSGGVFVAGAMPFRHGKNGGTKIVIGGRNFGSSPKVKIGAANCAVTKASNTEITCVVPRNSAGAKSVTVTSSSGGSSSLAGAVLYMNV